MAKDRIASGKTISQVKAANKESMRVNARSRYLASKTGIPSNLPAGSFGISEAGRIQAEKNRAEAAAKKRKEAEAAAKKEATRRSTFDPTRANTNTVSFSASYNNPLSSNRYFNLGKNIRVPNEDTASFRKLFKDDDY